MPNSGGNFANENSHPDKSANTTKIKSMNMVPPGGSAIDPEK